MLPTAKRSRSISDTWIWGDRPAGRRGLLFQSLGLYPDGDPQPARSAHGRDEESVARRQLNLGLRRYERAELEAVRAAGEWIHIQVLGLAVIAPDVSVELARATIASIEVLGALQASPEIKAALSDRIR